MVEFADTFQLLPEFVVVSQPPLDTLFLLGPDADLLVPASGVIDGENQGRVSAAPGAGLATLLMPNRAFEQRAAQNLAGRIDRMSQLIALACRILIFHLLR